jgi:hypothetical protein
MRRTSVIFPAALLFGVCVAVSPAMAQGRGRGGGTAMHAPQPRTQSPAQAHQQTQSQAQRKGQQGMGAARSAGKPGGHGAVEYLDRHPDQAGRMQQLLPPGSDVHQAADGFKNWGQFVAAAHVSKNLNIPFDQLKARMTGPDSVSLGKAIQEMRPDLSRSEVKESVKEAKRLEEQERKAEREQARMLRQQEKGKVQEPSPERQP